MLKSHKKTLTFLICLLCLGAQAQSLVSTHDIYLSLCSTDSKTYPSSNAGPYSLSFESELPYLIGTTGLFGVGILLQQTNKADPFTLDELSMLDRNNINGFDRGATFKSSQSARSASDILFNLSFGLPTAVFLVNKHTRGDVVKLFVMGSEVMLITGGLNLNAKHIFNRARPYTFNTDFSIDTRTNGSSRLSFFSGHTSQTAAATFFTAKVISDYHPNMNKGLKIGMWTTAVAIPAVTGVLRVESGRHYNSDVIAGFAIGAAVGWLVPHLNEKKTSRMALTPFSNGDASGLSFVFKLNN